MGDRSLNRPTTAHLAGFSNDPKPFKHLMISLSFTEIGTHAAMEIVQMSLLVFIPLVT